MYLRWINKNFHRTKTTTSRQSCQYKKKHVMTFLFNNLKTKIYRFMTELQLLNFTCD